MIRRNTAIARCCFFFSSRRRHTRSLCDWSSACALPICYSWQPTTISRVSPVDGPPSTRVVIEGDHFDSRTQNIEVAFNGTTAKIISASVNAITAVVPFGATSGPITVSLFAQTATGPAFTVTAAPPSTNFAGPSFNFIDASSNNGGTVLTFSNNDDAIALVRLPFDFILFRDIYLADSQISISTDGYLSLEPLSISEWQNAPLPSRSEERRVGKKVDVRGHR